MTTLSKPVRRQVHLTPRGGAGREKGDTMNATPLEVKLAIGRLLRILSRPTQPGDMEDYYRVRDIIIASRDAPIDHAPNWARDRLNGAQGD